MTKKKKTSAVIKDVVEDAVVVDQVDEPQPKDVSEEPPQDQVAEPNNSTEANLAHATEEPAENSLDVLDEHGTSLSARILRGLGLIAVGVALALWGAPKLAPMLPAGLAPVSEFLMPGQISAKADVAALRADVLARITALETAPKETVSQDAIDAALDAYKAEITAEVATLKDAVAATDSQDIESRLASVETRLAGVSAELAAVGERLSLQITENGAALSEEAAAKLSGYQAVMEGLRAQVEDLAAKNGALNQKVDEVAAAAQRRVQEAEAEATNKVTDTATKKLLTDLSLALDSGTSFAPVLSSISTLPSAPEIPAALSNIAETGTPTWANLRSSFPAAAQSALRADTTANADDSVFGKFGAFLKTQVGTRSIERQEGTSTDAILSRVEDELVQRNLSAALAEANSLAPEPKAAIMDWVANLAALTNAQSALAELTSTLAASN